MRWSFSKGSRCVTAHRECAHWATQKPTLLIGYKIHTVFFSSYIVVVELLFVLARRTEHMVHMFTCQCNGLVVNSILSLTLMNRNRAQVYMNLFQSHSRDKRKIENLLISIVGA